MQPYPNPETFQSNEPIFRYCKNKKANQLNTYQKRFARLSMNPMVYRSNPHDPITRNRGQDPKQAIIMKKVGLWEGLSPLG